MTLEHDLAELSALNARFIHNFITRDVESHDEITHPDFTLINASGLYWNKGTCLEDWGTAFDPDVMIYFDLRDERISIFGDTALVRATNKHIIVSDGKEVAGMTVYTDTYVRERGVWLCVQAQLTSVTPDNYPPNDTIITRYVRGEKQPA